MLLKLALPKHQLVCLLLFLHCKAVFVFDSHHVSCLVQAQFNPLQVLKDVCACSLQLHVNFLPCPEYNASGCNILRASLRGVNPSGI